MDNEKQIIPISSLIKRSSRSNKTTMINPDHLSAKKYKLIELPMDMARNITYRYDAGSKSIKVREDISRSLQTAKTIINNLQSVLSCEAINVDIKNDNISDLARVGLEINLNSKAGLDKDSSFLNDDYFVGPDYSSPIGGGYKLKVYGLCSRIPLANNTNYKIINEPIDIYDIRDRVGKQKPLVTKILKPVIDITKILEEYGFIQKHPHEEFFINSRYDKSNWNVFYNTNNLKAGYTYSYLLSSMYANNGEKIWLDGDKIWNGNKFIWQKMTTP